MQKINHILLGLLLLFTGLCFSPPAIGGGVRTSIVQVQQLIESRVTAIVRAADPTAVVIVRLKPLVKPTTPLPGTPFIVEELAIRDEVGDFDISQVQVIVMNDEAKLAKPVSSLVMEVAGDFGPVDLKVMKLPAELHARALASESSKSIVSSAQSLSGGADDKQSTAANAAPNLASPSAAAGGQGIGLTAAASPTAKHLPGIPSWADQYLLDSRAVPLAIFILIFLLALGSGIITVSMRSSSQRVSKALTTGLSGLASNMGSAGLGGAERSLLDDDSIPASESRVRGGISDLTVAVFAGLNEEGLISLLADCYWCRLDSYAAYIWRQIPVQKRRPILAKVDYLPEYAAYLVGMEGKDLGLENEPSYLVPLPIWHLDNRAITDLLRQQPGLRFSLSSSRMAGLTLTPKERVELAKSSDRFAPINFPDFEQMPGSPRRKLAARMEIPLNTVEEEREVLAIPYLPVEIMEGVPTLGWLSQLPDKFISEELAKYSAKDSGLGMGRAGRSSATLGTMFAADKTRAARDLSEENDGEPNIHCFPCPAKGGDAACSGNRQEGGSDSCGGSSLIDRQSVAEQGRLTSLGRNRIPKMRGRRRLLAQQISRVPITFVIQDQRAAKPVIPQISHRRFPPCHPKSTPAPET